MKSAKSGQSPEPKDPVAMLNRLMARRERGERITVEDVQLAGLVDIEAEWEARISRQKDAINRLLGIIEFVRLQTKAQAQAPEETLRLIKEKLDE
jgi:hypothetical protein